MKPPVIAILTDFGTRDPYVAEMKGVIAEICPDARITDVTHEVEPQNITQAAFLLGCALPWFPSGTVFVTVVDPGVGSDRRGIALLGRRHRYVGPDNGVFERAFELDAPVRAFSIENPEYTLPRVSATFHGRDVFAPVAAHIARGVDPRRLGPPVSDAVRRPWSAFRRVPDRGITGSICHVDRFGNCITDIPGDQVGEGEWKRLVLMGPAGDRIVSAPLVRTYSDVAGGQPAAVVGGTGFVELAVNGGSAAARYGIRFGDAVRIE